MQKVAHDVKNYCFWVGLNPEYKAKVEYKMVNGVMHITSTYIPEPMRGKGCGKIMMEAVLPEIEALGYKIYPVCSYVAHYIENNKQWAELLAREA